MARPGGWALAFFGAPSNATLLRALRGGPADLEELATAAALAGGDAEAALAQLLDAGLVGRRGDAAASRPGAYELRPLGREMLIVAAVLETWLGRAPGGPLRLDLADGQAAVRALLSAWESRLVRALAAGPKDLGELQETLLGVAAAELPEGLAELSAIGLLEAGAPAAPIALTDWCRRALAPLAVAVRCERVHVPAETVAPTPVDFETAFLLGLPLISLEPEVEGYLLLRIENRRDSAAVAHVLAQVGGGGLIACEAKLEVLPRDWVSGSERLWVEAVGEGELDGLEYGGDVRLGKSLVTALRQALV